MCVILSPYKLGKKRKKESFRKKATNFPLNRNSFMCFVIADVQQILLKGLPCAFEQQHYF